MPVRILASFVCLVRLFHALDLDAARPREGKVRRGGDNLCPSNPNPHVWVCNSNAGSPTPETGIAALGGCVLGVLPDSLEPICEKISISGLDSEVELFLKPGVWFMELPGLIASPRPIRGSLAGIAYFTGNASAGLKPVPF